MNMVKIPYGDSTLNVLSGDDCYSDNLIQLKFTSDQVIKHLYYGITVQVKNTTATNLSSMLFKINGEQKDIQIVNLNSYIGFRSSGTIKNFQSKMIQIDINPIDPKYQLSVKTYIPQLGLNGILCPKFCIQCDSNTQACTECQAGYYIFERVCGLCFQNCNSCDINQCFTCNPGYYKKTSTECQKCDDTCATCDGPNPNNCLTCKSPYYYQQTRKTCVKSCDVNEYSNGIFCLPCHQNCASCTGPNPNNCTSCYPGKMWQESTKECVSYFCDQTCKTCDGPDPNNCLSCVTKKKLQISTRRCVDDCSSNEFTNSQVQCQLCQKSCGSCNGPDSNNCVSCNLNSYLYNNSCVQICPNGFQNNPIKNTCDKCERSWIPQCNLCYPSCKQCNQVTVNPCQNCYTETRLLDAENKCVCQNSKDKRDNFYHCSFNNIAVLEAKLQQDAPILTIEFGSPIKMVDTNQSQSLCQQIFEQITFDQLGSDSSCSISGNQVLVNLGDSSTIMENDEIKMKPGKLQFEDYKSVTIDTFFRYNVLQIPPAKPDLEFSYNQIQNSCNPLNITLSRLRNDAGRKFRSLNWTLVGIEGTINEEQKNKFIDILQQASKNNDTALIIDPKHIPPNLNIQIQFNAQLKVNTTYQQNFTIFYQKQKFIRTSYLQYPYPPNYSIEICDQGQITYLQEPVDLKFVSNQLQFQSISSYNQSSYQLDILPYQLLSNQTFNVTIILNLSSDDKVVANQSVSTFIQVSDLFLQIVGGSSLVAGFQNKLYLNTTYRDFEIDDPNSAQNIYFSWTCYSLSSSDHACYDYDNKVIQLQQGVSDISIPAKTFQPYTAIVITVTGKKDKRVSSFTTTCIFSELDIPPLQVLFSTTYLTKKINLNDYLSFTIIYSGNISSDILSYAGALLYQNNAVGAIQFDYSQVKFRIWDYFQNVNPSKPTLQIRFSVYNPLYIMPSLSTITITVNIPPKDCILDISPLEGVALETIFTISFLHCRDEDLPLTYQFFYYNSLDDMKQEIISPQLIVRRLISDQSLQNTIQTILPEGNLVIMSQVMDSYLGVYNATSIIPVYSQNKSAEDYYQFTNQLVLSTLSGQNQQTKNQLVTFCVIGEDINKNSKLQFSQKYYDLLKTLITKMQELSLNIPKFSLLSTFTNKINALLTYQLQSLPQQSQSSWKDQQYQQLQNIIQNTYLSIKKNDINLLQENNDLQLQNIVDSFKILNSSIVLNNNNNKAQDYQKYDDLSTQIGNLISNISLPNQGKFQLIGNLSTIMSDKITQKNLQQYAHSYEENNSENTTNIFSIFRNTYYQNIYESEKGFQTYIQRYQNIIQNFNYSKNELIQVQIQNLTSQTQVNQNIIYQFNNVQVNPTYNMTCLQKQEFSWSKNNCSILNYKDDSYICQCKSQQPTTILEDLDDMFLKNKNLQTAFGKQGFDNISNFEYFYVHAVFWVLVFFTIIQISLFFAGKFLDKLTLKKNFELMNQNQQDNQQLNQQPQEQPLNKQDVLKLTRISEATEDENPTKNNIQKENIIINYDTNRVYINGRRKRQKFLKLNSNRQDSERNQLEEENIFQKEINTQTNTNTNTNINTYANFNTQLTLKQQSSIKQLENLNSQATSQSEIIKNESTEIKGISKYQNLSTKQKIAIFHQFFSIFYLYNQEVSRPVRFTLIYLKVIHTLVISLIFQGYNLLDQQIVIALINSSIIKLVSLGIIFLYKKGKIGKFVSVFLQLILCLGYYYLTLAICSGKSPSESNKFIFLFLVSIFVEMVFTELIMCLLMIQLVKKYLVQSDNENIYYKLFDMFDLKQTIESIDI